jgi:AcrR family transcriptional regulator
MGRWKPDARGRLIGSALQLYAERGFEQTTALDIAERAGVTERTFFRHFADKREVLFDGSSDLQAMVVDAVRAAPPSVTPIKVVGAAMVSAAALLQDYRESSQHRARVIAANPSLLERELLKLSTLADAVCQALVERGVPELPARLAAETGVTVFKVGYERWVGDDAAPELAQCITQALDQLEALAAEG